MSNEMTKHTFGFLSNTNGTEAEANTSVLGTSLTALIGPRATVPKVTLSKEGIAYALMGDTISPQGSLGVSKMTVIVIGVGYANGLFWPEDRVPEGANAKVPVCASNIADRPETAVGRYRNADDEWTQRKCITCPYAQFNSAADWNGKTDSKGTACSRKIVLAVLPVERVANLADAGKAWGIPGADRLGDFNLYKISQSFHSEMTGSDFLVARLSLGTNRDVLKQIVSGAAAMKRAIGAEHLAPENVIFAMEFEAMSNGPRKWGTIKTVRPMGIIDGDATAIEIRRQAGIFQDVFVKVQADITDAEVDAVTEADTTTQGGGSVMDDEIPGF
jgi:hypothetical protein